MEYQQRENFFNEDFPYKNITKLKFQLIKLLANINKNSVGLAVPMFSRNFIMQLLIKSKGSTLPLMQMERVNQAKFGNKALNIEKRENLFKLNTSDEFVKLVLNTLKINMPINFVEAYQEAVEDSNKCYPYTPRTIVSNGWMGDDLIKFWGAKQQEKGTRLIDVQHGGGYGAGKYSSYEYLGRKNCDAFISWGWQETEETIKAPSTLVCEKFYERNWEAREKNNKLILWTITEADRYLSYFESCLESMTKEYLDWQSQFVSHLDPTYFPELVMRLRPKSKYYFLKDKFPQIKVDIPHDRASFFDELYKAKLLISDNLGTVFHYGLAFNIPTLIFWDKSFFEIRDEARPYYDLLQEAGIYHDSAKSAAMMLNKIAKNPHEWWDQEEIQKVRKIFVIISHTFRNIG